MRKWLLSVLILALLGCSCVLGESEAGTQKLSCGDYDYVLLEDGTASITGYHGSAAELSIPEELDGRRVSSIGDYAFIGCTTLTSNSPRREPHWRVRVSQLRIADGRRDSRQRDAGRREPLCLLYPPEQYPRGGLFTCAGDG